MGENQVVGVTTRRCTVYSDERGYFFETFAKEECLGSGSAIEYVQDNFSSSVERVLRGLHYQFRQPQAQLVTVLRGSIFDVTLDVRLGSPTFGHWFGATLEQGDQIYMPAGVAHGFLVVGVAADLHYRVTEPYRPENEAGIRWNDPDVGIQWPFQPLSISKRDAGFPLLAEVEADRLPVFGG